MGKNMSTSLGGRCIKMGGFFEQLLGIKFSIKSLSHCWGIRKGRSLISSSKNENETLETSMMLNTVPYVLIL